jgi:hypothetical protein
MHILQRLAFVGTLSAGLWAVAAEAAPLVGPQSAPGSSRATSFVQYYYRDYPRWFYGPKWGGFGSGYRYSYPGYGYYGYYGYPSYGYYGYYPGYRSYGYYPRYRYRGYW